MRWLSYTAVIFFSTIGNVLAQQVSTTDTIFSLPTSTRPFTVENFYSLIIANHPIAKQAGLLSEAARQ